MASEHKIQQEVILACSRGDVRLWRNNVGKVLDQNGRMINFGLCVGSSDLIGYKTITVTSDMVGQRIAVFSALEIKGATGRPTAQQCAFLEQIKKAGGIADIARSVQDAQMILHK